MAPCPPRAICALHHRTLDPLAIRLERADCADEIAGIGKIDVVDAGPYAGPRDPVVAFLEGAGSIDEQKGPVLVEDSSDIAVAIGLQRGRVRQSGSERLCRFKIAPGDQNPEAIACKASRQARAEPAGQTCKTGPGNTEAQSADKYALKSVRCTS